MFQVLDFGPGEAISLHVGPDSVGLPPEGIVRWVDLENATREELTLLRDRFNFHPLSIDDCGQFDSRPKLDEFREHLFVVTQGLRAVGDRLESLDISELHTFIGNRYLVTVHSAVHDAIGQVWKRCSQAPSPLGRGPDFAYYLIADAITDLCFPVLDRVSEELSEIEDRVLRTPKKEDLERTFELRRLLAAMRKVVAPQRDILSRLARHESTQISERTALYLRDVAEHLSRLTESIEVNRDLLNNSIEGYVSATSMRTNEIMKSLTLLSAVFLPLTFVVGFFGQNFEELPGAPNWTQSPALAWSVVAFCALTPVVMMVWFRAKSWL
jgi:magnesium transporter